MTLKLESKVPDNIPVEVDGLVPDAVRELSLAQIEQLPVQRGNQQVFVAELFKVSGDSSDGRLEFAGELAAVHRIGAGMASGEVHVSGNAGRHIGSGMRGGRLEVHGDVSDAAGAEMHGGLIHIHGHAGDHAGAAYPGSRRGMTGGVLLIDGNAGREVAHTMRRGLIAVRGDVGDEACLNMIAGTLLVFGRIGQRPAAGMRRGTLGVLGADSPELLPTFPFACRYQPEFLKLYLRQLRELGFAVADELLACDYLRYSGDLVTLGKGEVLVRA